MSQQCQPPWAGPLSPASQRRRQAEACASRATWLLCGAVLHCAATVTVAVALGMLLVPSIGAKKGHAARSSFVISDVVGTGWEGCLSVLSQTPPSTGWGLMVVAYCHVASATWGRHPVTH